MDHTPALQAAQHVEWADFAPVFFLITSVYIVIQGATRFLKDLRGRRIKCLATAIETGTSSAIGLMLACSAWAWLDHPGEGGGTTIHLYLFRVLLGAGLFAVLAYLALRIAGDNGLTEKELQQAIQRAQELHQVGKRAHRGVRRAPLRKLRSARRTPRTNPVLPRRF